MDRLLYVYKSVVGPRLYAVYSLNKRGSYESLLYEPNILERTADQTLATANGIRHFATALWPLTLVLLYRRGWFDPEWIIKFAIGCAILYGGAFTFRAVGRLLDDRYQSFVRTLVRCERDPSASNRRRLQLYDFDIWAKPTDYSWTQSIRGEKVKPRQHLTPLTDAKGWNMPFVQRLQDCLCSVAVHTFGRRMLYPGSVSLLNALVHPALLEGRKKLMNRGAVRSKLLTRMGDTIDTAFVDARNNANNGSNGSILVITCEGNAGFYEIGAMGTILELGYSVLGWNHPGTTSSGTPWPMNVAAAVDTVMQYATTVLGFTDADVVVYAWSIGGYPATWAVMNYPEIRGVVLDATFDDLMPLAQAKMPKSWAHLVHQSVRDYLDLPISRQLNEYHGPVLLIRRRRDEIICTEEGDEMQRLRTNRAKQLLINLLQSRYPVLFAETADACVLVENWLEATETERATLLTSTDVDEERILKLINDNAVNDTDENRGSFFPSSLGADLSMGERSALLLFLSQVYLTDFDSMHNNPLPKEMFRVPRHPWDLLLD